MRNNAGAIVAPAVPRPPRQTRLARQSSLTQAAAVAATLAGRPDEAVEEPTMEETE